MIKVEELMKLRRQYNEKLSEFGKDVFSELAVKALEQCPPEIIGLKWSQYTPFFNDGDACVFYVHEIQPIIDPEARTNAGEEYCEYTDSLKYFIHQKLGLTWDNQKDSEEFKQMVEQFGAAFDKIRTLPKDVFLTVFGDHSQVEIFRDGSVKHHDYDDHD